MKKRGIAVLLTAALALGTLSGCGSDKKDDKTITVAASATPHAEILEQAKGILAEQGWTLEVTVFDVMLYHFS